MLCWNVVEGLSWYILVSNTAIAHLSAEWTTQFVLIFGEANTVVDADIIPHMGYASDSLDGTGYGAYSLVSSIGEPVAIAKDSEYF